MKNYNILILIAALVTGFSSCKKDFQDPVGNIEYSAGEADFSKYIALGNSLTAGSADNTLYRSAQLQSYPSIIAEAMAYAGGGDFRQPLMPNDVGGFSDLGFSGKLTLQEVNGSLTPVSSAAGGELDDISGLGPYQNLGVPGAKLIHLLLPGYGSALNLSLGVANPFYVRFASSSNTNILSDATSQSPTFFSLWIGSNDVLGYATEGGAADSITDPQTFSFVYSTLLEQLLAGGAKGVLANIPNINDIPLFTTIPYAFISLSDGQVDTINAPQIMGGLSQIINAIDPSRNIEYLKGVPNKMLIKDRSLPNIANEIADALVVAGRPAAEAAAIGYIYGQARMTTSQDLVLLTASSEVGTLDSNIIALGGPSAAPLAIVGITAPTDALVLDPSEQAKISSAISSYNQTIQTLAEENNLAFVDANSMMSVLKSNAGMRFNGVDYMTQYITGGAFSLDGVHPTPRGYAIIANAFVTAINARYGSNIPMVNPNNYDGIMFP